MEREIKTGKQLKINNQCATQSNGWRIDLIIETYESNKSKN